MDLNIYRAEIRAKYAELQAAFPTGFLHVVSLLNKTHGTTAGKCVEVSIANGARLLVDNTHRLAEESEIAAFDLRNETEGRRLEQTESRRRDAMLRIRR
jgi:hypothetical protein